MREVSSIIWRCSRQAGAVVLTDDQVLIEAEKVLQSLGCCITCDVEYCLEENKKYKNKMAIRADSI